jgi:phytoene synthase
VLPAPKRRAIYAVYAFCRVVDDCVDEAGGGGENALRQWEGELARAYADRPTTELGRELAEAVAHYRIPRRCFDDIVAGCRMDLEPARYPTFADLRVYCERVASAVGLASIEIFGYRDQATRVYAVELGIALQLTNILRDVAGDAERGRLYLPLEDLARFQVSESDLLAAAREGRPRTHRERQLLAFEAERARAHYAQASGALPGADRRAMAAAEIMRAVYRATLEEWAERGYRWRPRVRLSRLRRAWIAARTFLAARRAAP